VTTLFQIGKDKQPKHTIYRTKFSPTIHPNHHTQKRTAHGVCTVDALRIVALYCGDFEQHDAETVISVNISNHSNYHFNGSTVCSIHITVNICFIYFGYLYYF